MNRWILRSLIALYFLPGVAASSPWTQPGGGLSMQAGYIVQGGSSQYNTDGGQEPYPLSGRQFSGDLIMGLRYGLSDRVELELGTVFKVLGYQADLACVDTTVEPTSPASYQCPTRADTSANAYGDLAVLNFNTILAGLADATAQIKVKLLEAPLVLTVAPFVKVPTGYDAPAALGESTTDDLTLGDGQIDAGGFLYLGRVIPSMRTFLRFDLGYLHRFGAPGDQVVSRLRAGYELHPRVLLAIGGQLEKTVTSGEEVGKQGIRIESDGTIIAEPIRSERDRYVADTAVIIRVNARTEAIVGAFTTVGGRYTAASRGFGMGILRRFY